MKTMFRYSTYLSRWAENRSGSEIGSIRKLVLIHFNIIETQVLVRGDRDSRANLMPIYGDLYQIKL